MLQASVGHYLVLGPIGSGGMGSVFKALDTRLNRPVALKVIHPRHVSQPDAIERLKREALAAASLDDPYICKVYELLEDGAQTMVVMEYVEGETLASRLCRGPLPVDLALRYAAEVSEALVEAHAKRVVHRDIKPSNIMITSHDHVKVMDFGIASCLAGPDDPTTTQTAVAVAGTPGYMAPEQAEGRKVDARADIFSLGVVLYQCLAAKPPFDCHAAEAYGASLSRGPESIRKLRHDLPREVERTIRRCLERDVQKRFQSAMDVLGTLNDLRGDTHDRATGDRRWWPMAHAKRTVGVIAGALVLVLGGWLAVSRYLRTSDARFEVVKYSPISRGGEDHGSRISPDGRWVSYLSSAGDGTGIWQKPLDRPDGSAQLVTTPRGEVIGHAWAPDSNDIAYLRVAQGVLQLEVVPRSGREEPAACWDTELMPSKWARVVRWVDGWIYVESSDGLHRFATADGRREEVRLPASVNPARASDFDIDPDGREIVFSSATEKSIHRDLWRFNLEDKMAVPLLADGNTNTRPVWLGRGRRALAFRSNQGGQTDLWGMRIGDRQTSRLTTGRGEELPNDSSDDGRTLTYELHEDRSRLHHMMSGETAEPLELTTATVNEAWPSAAVSTRTIAFQSTGPVRPLGWDFLDSEIRLCNRGTGSTGTRVIAQGYGPAVSPDGRLVAFLRQPPDQAQRTQLWVYDPEENQPRMISERFQNPGVFMTPLEPTAVNVAWAADSSELYFVEKDDPLSAHSRLAALRSGRPRGTAVPLLEVPETIQDVRPARTRPEIAFVRRSAAPYGRVRFGLSVLDMKTRQVRQIHGGESAAKGADVRLLGWSADGSRLVFLEVTPNDDQTNRVVVRGVSIADGTLWPVGTLQRAYACTARLDPSGRSVFIVRRDKGANVLMTLAVVGGVVSDRHNTGRESIVLEGITFTTSNEVVFARHEQAREIWAISLGQPR